MSDLVKITAVDKVVAEIAGVVKQRRAELEKDLAPYMRAVVTAETLPAWKKDRARLNKERTATKKERTTMEAEWKELLAPISDEYRLIDSAYEKALGHIDEQSALFERERRRAKRAHINKLWAEYEPPAEVAGWLNIEEVLGSPKWENATTTDKEILKEIDDKYTSIHDAYMTVKAMRHAYEVEGLDTLRRTKSVVSAIERMNDLAKAENVVLEKLAENDRTCDTFIDDFSTGTYRVSAVVPAECLPELINFMKTAIQCEFTYTKV